MLGVKWVVLLVCDWAVNSVDMLVVYWAEK